MEGPLSNLQPSMIQFSKPRQTLTKAMEQFRRFETPVTELQSGAQTPMESE